MLGQQRIRSWGRLCHAKLICAGCMSVESRRLRVEALSFSSYYPATFNYWSCAWNGRLKLDIPNFIAFGLYVTAIDTWTYLVDTYMVAIDRAAITHRARAHVELLRRIHAILMIFRR
jgi:hypothetical protein